MKGLQVARAEVNRVGVLVSLSALGLTAIFPSVGWAEGAVRLLECTVARVCDSAGVCEAGSGEVAFRMEPLDTSADGSGSYSLSYGDTRAEMRALSSAGPFVWTVGTERHTLLASSDTEFLWHRLTLDRAPTATISFLSCAFRQ